MSNEPAQNSTEIDESEDPDLIFDKDLLSRQILDLNEEISDESLTILNNQSKLNSDVKIRTPLSKGMLWHIKLGHVSSKYLKALQKSEELLKDIKFIECFSDCEVCIMAKMEKLAS